jgi:hypothetical protein
MRGILVGGGVVASFGGAAFLLVLWSGTAPTMMGETAEQWTAQSLRPLLDHDWHLVNHVPLGGGDIDHLLIGPDGVIVVETKWSRDPWAMTERDATFAHALGQVKRQARSIGHLLGTPGEVRRVIVLWGGAKEKVKESTGGRLYEGTTVIAGPQLDAWALRLGRGALQQGEIERLWSRLLEYLSTSDPHEDLNNPVPEGITRATSRIAAAVCGGLSAMILSWYAVKAPLGIWLWLLSSLALSGIVLVRPVRRRFPLGTLAVSTAASAGLITIVVLAALRSHYL